MMKLIFYKLLLLFIGGIVLNSCKAPKASTPATAVDLVCEMKIKTSDSYRWKWHGTKYYFDSYICREAFKNDPKNYIDKRCSPNDKHIDLVCGKTVNLSESFDLKYSGKIYHFDTYTCKQTFKMNPEKFIKNKCSIGDSIR